MAICAPALSEPLRCTLRSSARGRERDPLSMATPCQTGGNASTSNVEPPARGRRCLADGACVVPPPSPAPGWIEYCLSTAADRAEEGPTQLACVDVPRAECVTGCKGPAGWPSVATPIMYNVFRFDASIARPRETSPRTFEVQRETDGWVDECVVVRTSIEQRMVRSLFPSNGGEEPHIM